MNERDHLLATRFSSISAKRCTALALRFGVVPLLATLSIAACKEGSPAALAAAQPSTHASARVAAEVGTIPPTGGFAVQVLSRSSFPDAIDVNFRIKLHAATKVVHVNDPSQVVVAKVTIQPGGSLGWHTHHGPAIASVASGELTVIHADDCAVKRYPGGQAFVDPGQGHVHIGFNASAAETVVYVTFLDVPPGSPPTVLATAPSC